MGVGHVSLSRRSSPQPSRTVSCFFVSVLGAVHHPSVSMFFPVQVNVGWGESRFGIGWRETVHKILCCRQHRNCPCNKRKDGHPAVLCSGVTWENRGTSRLSPGFNLLQLLRG